ncbi:MAG: hypothetical protein KAS18_07700 [Calditrichia bacterium]|nr:hypothetical protein [Calditrichia bacterium]
MKNCSKISFLIVILICGSLILNGCYVGARVNLTASHCEFPVSYTDNYYDSDYNLVSPEEYEIQEGFILEFTKWGITSPLNIEGEEDISKILNDVIKKNNADAIIDLQVSVSSSPLNGFFLFTKVISLWVAMIAPPVYLSDPSTDNAVIALSSIAVYLFTPAVSHIKVEGKVVKSK